MGKTDKDHRKKIELRNKRLKETYVHSQKVMRKKLEDWKEQIQQSATTETINGPLDIRFKL